MPTLKFQISLRRHNLRNFELILPVPVAARSKACVCGSSPAGIVGSNPTGGMDYVVGVVCFQVEVPATS